MLYIETHYHMINSGVFNSPDKTLEKLATTIQGT